MAQNTVAQSKVTVLGPKAYDWMSEENYRIGTHLGNNSYKINVFDPLTGASAATSGSNLKFSQLMADGYVSSTPKLRTSLTVKVARTTNATVDQAEIVAPLNNKIGLQSLPHHRMISTSAVKLNGSASMNNNPSQEADLVVHSQDPRNLALASQASVVDKYSAYDNASISNPLVSGADVDQASLQCRGFGSNYDVQFSNYNDGGAGAPSSVDCTITFDSAIPSIAFQHENMKDAQPFYNLTNLEIDLILNDVFKSVLAVNGAYTTAAGGTFTITGDAASERVITFQSVRHQLVINSWNPSIKLNPPRTLVYGSHDITLPYSQGGVSVATGATNREITINSFVLNGVPQMFALMVRRPHLDGQPHTFLPISQVSFDMDNKSNLLREYSQYELYEMSAKNGLVDRFATFTGQSSTLATSNPGAGSVVLFRPSDLPLNEGTVAGSNKNFSVRGTITVNSVVPTPVVGPVSPPEECTVELYAIYDQVLKFDGKNFSYERPLLDKLDIVESKVQFVDDSSSMNHLVGGSWASDIWGWLKRAAQSPFAKAASQFGRNNIPVVSDFVRDGTMVGNFAKSQGYGKGTKGKGKKISAGQVLKLGGKQMSQRDLEALLVE